MKTPEEKQQELDRERAQERADRNNQRSSDTAFTNAISRAMGKRGSSAFFTGSGAGFSRTLGGGNVMTVGG